MSFTTQSAEQVLGIHPRALDLSLPAADTLLAATLDVPIGARALVVVLTPPGVSRFAPGQRFAVQLLEQSGLATLLLDPLSTEPEVGGSQVLGSDVRRLSSVLDWLGQEAFTAALPVGLLITSAEMAVAAAAAPSLPTFVVPPALDTARSTELASEFFVSHLLEAHGAA